MEEKDLDLLWRVLHKIGVQGCRLEAMTLPTGMRIAIPDGPHKEMQFYFDAESKFTYVDIETN